MTSHHEKGTVIIFDSGHRRLSKIKKRETFIIDFTLDMKLSISKDGFSLNPCNKQKLYEMINLDLHKGSL